MASRHSYLRPVNGFLNWLHEEGEAAKGRAPLLKVPKPLRAILSDEDITLMEKAARNERDRS
jgi:hypothetical protein